MPAGGRGRGAGVRHRGGRGRPPSLSQVHGRSAGLRCCDVGRGTSPPNGSLQKGTASKVRALCRGAGVRAARATPGPERACCTLEGRDERVRSGGLPTAVGRRPGLTGAPASEATGREPCSRASSGSFPAGLRASPGSPSRVPGQVCVRSCGARPEGAVAIAAPSPARPEAPLWQEVDPSWPLPGFGEAGEPLPSPLYPGNLILKLQYDSMTPSVRLPDLSPPLGSAAAALPT